jgi:anti-sigma regulatory factor (Ser/Thr protein kinase)
MLGDRRGGIALKDVLVAVGKELTHSGELAAAVGPMGYEVVPASPREAAGERASEAGASVVAIGPDVRPADAARILRRWKLSPQTNQTAVVAFTAGPPKRLPAQGMRVEPDLWEQMPLSVAQCADAISRVREQSRARAAEGVRFHLCVSIGSDIKLLREVEACLEGLLRECGLDPKQLWSILQSSRELGLNAVEWGNKNNRKLCVGFCFALYPDRFTAKITDQGAGFDPHNIPHAAHPDDPLGHIAIRETSGLRVGGYGILICRKLMDEVIYNEAGNEVTIVKRLNVPPTDGASEQ